MANVALHLCWAGRGLAARVVYDPNDLAHAAAAAGVHGGTPVSDDGLRLRTAALAEHFRTAGISVLPLVLMYPLPGSTRLAHGQPSTEGLEIPGINPVQSLRPLW